MPVLSIQDFSGGLNNRFSQNRIADNDLNSIRNSRWARVGALSKRFGTTRNLVTNGAGTALETCESCFAYQLDGMSAEQILISGITPLAATQTIVRATTLGTYTDLITGVGATFSPEYRVYNGLLYITDGAGLVRTVNSSNTVATPSGMPTSKFIEPHKGYLFTFNDDVGGNRSRIQWSDRNSSTFTSTNFEDIPSNDSSTGSGIISFGDELILFKSPRIVGQSYSYSSMWSLIGNIFDATSPTYQLEKIILPTGVGLFGNRSAKILNGALIFCTNDGFYAYDGGGRAPYPISESIRADIDGWEILLAETNRHRRAAATVFKNRYYCALTEDATTYSSNHVVYIYEDGKWWKDILGDNTDSMNAGSSAPIDWAIFGGNLYGAGFTGTTASILRQWEVSGVFTDTRDVNTTSNVNFSVGTKEYEFDEEQIFKYCFIILKRQSSGSLTFEYNIDQRGVVSQSVDMTTPDSENSETSSSNVLRKRVNIGRAGRTIQFRFHDRGNNDAEIYNIQVYHDKYTDEST